MSASEERSRLLAQDIERLLLETDALLWRMIDLSSNDTETTLQKIQLLRAAAELINIKMVEELGGRRGPTRSPGILESVIAAAFQSYGGEYPYPDHFQKAAMLWRGITGGHPFEDGNKRTGFMLAWYYLQRMGVADPSTWQTRDVIAFGIEISSHTIEDVETIARQLRRWWRG